jgi:hypothetical protein
MICDWSAILTDALKTLPPLHRAILIETMALPGRRRRMFYSDAMKFWTLDRHSFDRERYAALESIRRYLVSRGVTCPGDLTLR